MAVSSRLWLAGQISVTRDQALIDRLVRQGRSLVHGHVLVCVDGLASCVGAFQHLVAERAQHRGRASGGHACRAACCWGRSSRNGADGGW